MASTADQYTVRQHNTALIIATLRQDEPLSRAELAAQTGLNRSTVSSITNELIEKKAIEETILQSEKIGRPGMLLKLNPDFGFTIGIDLNVDMLRIVVMDFTYHIIWEKRIAVSDPSLQEPIIAQAMELTQEAMAFGLEKQMKPLGIGVAVPGLVDTHQGIMIFGPNLGWDNVPLRQLWQEKFNVPVFIENDANAAALGEFYIGEAKGIRNLVLINVGVGIGGGIIVEGNLLRGARGFASEVGHMVVDPNGKPCACGSRGCLETLIGTKAIISNARECLGQSPRLSPFVDDISINRLTLDQIVAGAAAGHPVCIEQLEAVADHLGLVVSELVNIFNPELVVIGGYSREMVLQILPDLRTVVQNHVMNVVKQDLDIRPSRFGNASSVIGAASLVFDHLTQPVF
jgi:glucokinase-like ROK family protein